MMSDIDQIKEYVEKLEIENQNLRNAVDAYSTMYQNAEQSLKEVINMLEDNQLTCTVTKDFKCSNCNSEIDVNLNFCGNCGSKIKDKKNLTTCQICSTCYFSHIYDGKAFPGKEYKGQMYCIAWSDGYQAEWTKPDGYCHKWKHKFKDFSIKGLK